MFDEEFYNDVDIWTDFMTDVCSNINDDFKSQYREIFNTVQNTIDENINKNDYKPEEIFAAINETMTSSIKNNFKGKNVTYYAMVAVLHDFKDLLT